MKKLPEGTGIHRWATSALVRRIAELEKRVADLEKENQNKYAGYPGYD